MFPLSGVSQAPLRSSPKREKTHHPRRFQTWMDALRDMHHYCTLFARENGILQVSPVSAIVRISGPWSVMATVCSNWAERRPSFVTTVHLSESSRVSYDPALIIGSIVRVIPDRSRGPREGCR